jgi:hypothetical protein
VEDEQRGVRVRAGEAEGGDEGHEAVVPSARGLLQAIESMVDVAHMIRTCRVNEPGGLLTEDHLRELPMEERILMSSCHIFHLQESDGENDPDAGGFNNRAEGLVEVDVMFLRETVQDPTGFIVVERTIRFELVSKTHLLVMMLALEGGCTRVHMSLAMRAPYSSVMVTSQFGSLRAP